MYKNLKIQINDQQPLDEVVRELGRLGYVKDTTLNDCACYVYTFEDGSYFVYMGCHNSGSPTTLSELKEM